MTQIKMTNKARKSAKSLAIAYSAFQDSNLEESPNSVVCWGRALLEAQEDMGIELATPSNVLSLITAGMRRCAEQE